MKKLNFSELSLSPEMQEAIGDMGFTEASHIQSEAIPFIQEGKDVIGQAQTGTGKTAAFGIPLLESLNPKEKTVSAVVLCPTRELAIQVANELKKLAKYKRGINVLAIYGGESIERQINALKRGVQVIVGTPGRVIDHLERKTLRFDNVKMAVLDEADEMLNMGFREDIENILERMPDEKQTVFFSATMPKAILDMVHRYQKSPKLVKVTNNELTNASIEQVYFEVENALKLKLVSRLIQLHNVQLALLFCNTKKKVDDVVKSLRNMGHKAEGIHGDLRQNQRNTVLSMFKRTEVNILVATDVAARGIDVSNVDVVFNYDLPLDPENYVHRIGRTGRAGKTGKAFSFVTGRNELRLLKDIERYSKVKVERRNLPSQKDLIELKKANLLTKLTAAKSAGDLEKFEGIMEYYRSEGFTLHELTLALLKMSLTDGNEGKEMEGERRERSKTFVNRDGKMVRLFINAGRKHKISKGDIAGALVGKSGLDFKSIGAIDVHDDFSFVEVSDQDAERAISGIMDKKIKGKKVNIEIARR
ncbi:MAG: DEAD/DEAH box helicase [Cytophagaceae bacterium]|nr:DEAD/DEAH box helicase [Cytophagaceae bacterium]